MVSIHDGQMSAIAQLVSAIAAHTNHAPPAHGLMNEPLVFQEVRPLIRCDPGTIAVCPESNITAFDCCLFALDKPTYELFRPKLISCSVPFIAVGDLNLLATLSRIQIWHSGAERRPGLFCAERPPCDPQASLVDLQACLEVGHQ